MKFSYPPLTSRICNILLIGGIVLLLSCQSDPIVLNPPGGYEYIKQTFQLDIENSYSIQGNAHTGHSPRLYSGILSNGDPVSALIKLIPDVLDSHQVCTADSIFDVKLELMSPTPIAVQDDTTFIDTLIKMNALKTYLIPSYMIDEDDSITHVILGDILDLSMDSLSVSLKNDNSIEINLFKHDPTIISRWCETQEELGIVVSYIPLDSSYLEFYSSDGTEVGLGPKLSLEYAVKEEVSNSYNRYLLNNVYWAGGTFDESDNGPYYVEKALSDNWDVINIYAFNLKENSPIPSNEMQSYNSLLFQDDIITTENLNSNIHLLKINVTLNSDIDIEKIDSIMFSLNSAIAFKSDDPAGDNVETHPDSTENNEAYDEGEIFNDYGLDKCPDKMEKDNGECADSEEESAFNSVGTEGNKQRDWTDYDGDGKWDLNEGEMWGDWGFDWCPDSLEDGSGGCLMEPSDIPLGYDPNEDNIDPVGDDWHEINNPDSTEGNQKWDPGEPFYDWGSDGLHESLMGYIDEMEDNNVYNEGEPFDDTGSDGLYNINELGYNINRTEGNDKFDGEGEFNDCGEDNCCDSKDNEGICDDVADDNYNIDPNEDNWNDCGSDKICPSSNIYTVEDQDGTEGNNKWDENEGTEKNILLDWTDANDENGVWDDGEGEEWFDWGLDGIHDTLEAFQPSSILLPNLYDNNYVFEIESGVLLGSPELVDSTVNLWISKIEETGNNELVIDISIHSNVVLKGLQFQLSHSPYTIVDTVFQKYEPLPIMQIGTEKLFEDLSLYPKKTYSKEELDEKMLIDYANDVSTFLDFDSLDIFLANGENIISHEYSNLVLYVDSLNTNIYNNMRFYVTHENSSGEDLSLLPPINISSISDSIEIPIGHVLSSYQSGDLDTYDKFKLKADGSLYNYSLLSIQHNSRLDIMYTK